MAAILSISSEPIRSFVVGEDIRLAGLVVGLIGVGVAVSLMSIPLLGPGDSGVSVLETVSFGVLPLLGGMICGWYSLGAIAVGGVGIVPGIVVYISQIVIGTNGDLSRVGFSFMLTTVTFPIALAGFGVGIAAAVFFR